MSRGRNAAATAVQSVVDKVKFIVFIVKQNFIVSAKGGSSKNIQELTVINNVVSCWTTKNKLAYSFIVETCYETFYVAKKEIMKINY